MLAEYQNHSVYTTLISRIKCKNWSSCILSPFVWLPVTSCPLLDLAESRHKQRKAWFFARSLGWDEFHWKSPHGKRMQQSSGSRDTALKKRRMGSVPSPAMALSNLVPVKKEQKQRNGAKRHQATTKPPTSDPPISWNQRIESSTKTRGHNTIDHHLQKTQKAWNPDWCRIPQILLWHDVNLRINRILSCLVMPKCHPNDIIHMSYPVPSCASFNGNADVAASLLSAGNANKAVNVAPRHEELVVQQGLSRRNASKDLDFRTSLKLVNLCTRSKLQRSQGTKINER